MGRVADDGVFVRAVQAEIEAMVAELQQEQRRRLDEFLNELFGEQG